MLSSSSARPPPRRRQKRSIVWRYFAESPADLNVAICSLCNAAIPRGRRLARNTTNLLKHLQNKHPHVIQDVHSTFDANLDATSCFQTQPQLQTQQQLHMLPKQLQQQQADQQHAEHQNPRHHKQHYLQHQDSFSDFIGLTDTSDGLEASTYGNQFTFVSDVAQSNDTLMQDCNLPSSGNNTDYNLDTPHGEGSMIATHANTNTGKDTTFVVGESASTTSSKTTNNSEDTHSNALTLSSVGDTNNLLTQSTTSLNSPLVTSNLGSHLVIAANYPSPNIDFSQPLFPTPSILPFSSDLSTNPPPFAMSASLVQPDMCPPGTGRYENEGNTSFSDYHSNCLQSNPTGYGFRGSPHAHALRQNFLQLPFRQPDAGNPADFRTVTQAEHIHRPLSVARAASFNSDNTYPISQRLPNYCGIGASIRKSSSLSAQTQHLTELRTVLDQPSGVFSDQYPAAPHLKPANNSASLPGTAQQHQFIPTQSVPNVSDSRESKRCMPAPSSGPSNPQEYAAVNHQPAVREQVPAKHSVNNALNAHERQAHGSWSQGAQAFNNTLSMRANIELIKHLAVRGTPLSCAMSSDFQQFQVNAVGLSSPEMTADFLRRNVLPVFVDSVRVEIQSLIARASGCALIVDRSSPISTVCCSWFTPEHELRRACLDLFLSDNSSHQPDCRESLFRRLARIVHAWGVTTKVSAVVMSGNSKSAPCCTGGSSPSIPAVASTRADRNAPKRRNSNCDVSQSQLAQNSTRPTSILTAATGNLLPGDRNENSWLQTPQPVNPVVDTQGPFAATEQQAGNANTLGPQSNYLRHLQSVPCAIAALENVVYEHVLSHPTACSVLSRVRSAIRGTRDHQARYAKEQKRHFAARQAPPPLIIDEDTQVCIPTTHLMLERYLQQCHVVRSALNSIPNGFPLDDALDHEVNEIRETLHIFLEALRVVDPKSGGTRGQSGYSVAVIIPVMKGLRRALSTRMTNAPQSNRFKNILQRLQMSLQALFKDSEFRDTYAIATILDPRFKNKVFESRTAARAAEERLHAMAKSEKGSDSEQTCSRQHSPSVKGSARPQMKRSRSVSEAELIRFDTGEVKQYLSEPIALFGVDVARYWRTNSQRWPILARAAAKYLCVPASIEYQLQAYPASSLQDAWNAFGDEDAPSLSFIRHNTLLGFI